MINVEICMCTKTKCIQSYSWQISPYNTLLHAEDFEIPKYLQQFGIHIALSKPKSTSSFKIFLFYYLSVYTNIVSVIYDEFICAWLAFFFIIYGFRESAISRVNELWTPVHWSPVILLNPLSQQGERFKKRKKEVKKEQKKKLKKRKKKKERKTFRSERGKRR